MKFNKISNCINKAFLVAILAVVGITLTITDVNVYGMEQDISNPATGENESGLITSGRYVTSSNSEGKVLSVVINLAPGTVRDVGHEYANGNKHTWKILDKTVAEVDDDGVLIAKTQGQTLLTGYDSSGKAFVNCLIYVVGNPVFPSINPIAGDSNIGNQEARNTPLSREIISMPKAVDGVEIVGNTVNFDIAKADKLVLRIEQDINLATVALSDNTGEPMVKGLDYTITKGSVVVTLEKNYLSKVMIGKPRKVKISTENGYTELELIARNKGATVAYPSAYAATQGEIPYSNIGRNADGSPRTGDSSNLYVFLEIGAVALVAFIAVTLLKNKKKK